MAMAAPVKVGVGVGFLDDGITRNWVTHHIKMPYRIAVSNFTFKIAGNVLTSQKKKNAKDIAIK